MAHNTTEIQQRLIDRGFLAPLNDSGLSNADGKFGVTTLAAYNRFRASKGEPPNTGLLLLVEVSADVFPEDAPPPAPKASNPITDYLTQLAIKALLANLAKGLSPMLTGYKTYIIAALMIALAVAGLLGWALPGVNSDPGALILAAIGLITGRVATANVAAGK